MPCASLVFCSGSRAVWPFSVRKTNPIEDLTPKVAKVSYFTVHFAPPPRAARIRRPLSRIRPGRALRRGKGATRRKRRRQNTVLSERRLRRSRARGWVDFRNCQRYRGSGGSDGEIPANLREIWDARFWSAFRKPDFPCADFGIRSSSYKKLACGAFSAPAARAVCLLRQSRGLLPC